MSEETLQPWEMKFEGRLADSGSVPAMILSEVIQAFQRTIHLIAMEVENKEVRQRAKLTAAQEQKYVLMCSAPKPGSLLVSTTFGNSRSSLYADKEIQDVSQRFVEVCAAIENENYARLCHLLPDDIRRVKTLESMRKMVPKKGSDIHLTISNGTPFFKSEVIGRQIKALHENKSDQETLRTVTGKLVRIDFNDLKITIEYPPTNKELDCNYSEESEVSEIMLFDNRRQMIQVTGRIILDDHDHPKAIRDVESICELDLSPFCLSDIQLKEKLLRFRKERVLEPKLDESKQLICLEDDELGIDIFAYTRDDLDEALTKEMDFLWHEYALAEDSELSPRALDLKHALLNALEEVSNAQG